MEYVVQALKIARNLVHAETTRDVRKLDFTPEKKIVSNHEEINQSDHNK